MLFPGKYPVLLSFVFVLTHFTLSLSASIESKRAPPGLALPLIRANQGRKTQDEKAAWARRQGENLIARYGGTITASRSVTQSSRRRGSGTNELVNHDQDSSYFGSLAVGTPAEAFNVILDTGSSDMWLAATSCRVGCSGIVTYDPNASSTFNNLSTAFQIQYGSGAAQGILGEDVVQMAGFSVPSQPFGIVTTVTSGLLTSPVSGLLGLGFQSISSSGIRPFWQTLVEGNAWDDPLMSFYLTRFINDTHASSQEPGGRFTMGFVDQALYTGEIEYVDIPSGMEGYWTIPMTSLSVNGQSMSLGDTVASSNSAIDTGTTLIGGPSSVIQEIFAAIPGSSAGTGAYQGYYIYPCSTTVQVSLSFGSGSTWSIDPADFMLTQLTPDECLGAFFSLDMGQNGPTWIVGDTFLKNVYSVFRYSPPSVGFANLSVSALDLAVTGGSLPSQTIGANPTTATDVNDAGGSSHPSIWIGLYTLATVLILL